MKIISLTLTVVVLAWILPLGAFIKPSQERTACGGRRAVHMCTAGTSSQASKPVPGRVSFTSSSAVEKADLGSNGAGAQALASAAADPQDLFFHRFLREADLPFPHRTPYFSLDPVPKP